MINADFLSRTYACPEGRAWFAERFPGGSATYEEAMAALVADGKAAYVLWLAAAVRHLTAEQRTPSVCELAVSRFGMVVVYITDAQRTERVCELAVTNDGFAVEYLSPAQRTPRVRELAVAQHRFAAEYFSVKQRTEP